MSEPYRILAIDGGGVRGVVAALVLAELEAETGLRVVDLFDFVAGTSAGALLALGLLRPDVQGGDRPRWAARELADLYADERSHIFHRSIWRTASTVNGFLAPKYGPGELRRQLRARLGDTRLSEALRVVMITAYDARRREPYFFMGGQAEFTPDDPLMRTVAQASAAAPSYFPPVRVQDPVGDERWLTDGGVVANNPALLAYIAARRRQPDRPVLLVSVGCGHLSTDLATPRMRKGGALLWARPLFDMMLDGQENVTDRQVQQLLPTGTYLRLQAELPDSCERIDDDSAANLRVLRASTERLLEQSEKQLREMGARLAGRPAVPQ